MPKTRFERLETGGPDTAAFRISGKLGFHENVKVEHLVEECRKREFRRVIFDLSTLSSLGGGVARILREFIRFQKEQGREVRFVITNDIVLDFLRDDDTQVDVYTSLEEASGAPGEALSGVSDILDAAEAAPEPEGAAGEEQETGGDALDPSPEVILMSYDGEEENVDGAAVGVGLPDSPEPETERAVPGREAGTGQEDGIISEIFSGESRDAARRPKSKDSSAGEDEEAGKEEARDINIKLKRRLLELKTLLSISADFNAIRDKKSLLDIFLLTSIAQGGVESAVFFERLEGTYIPLMVKGLDESEVPSIVLSAEDERKISGTHEVLSVDDVSFADETRAVLDRAGLEFFCPFMTSEGLCGLVFLGRRIAGRGMKKEDFEFMKILVNVASGSYQNALMIEREHERTLGIVKSLISLIEENTLLTGTSEFVSRYVGMTAKNMEYPEDHFKDLIYGTVLRDMGMIKVSDLILRSPRELTKEEWNIINRHPEDGAEMLRRMKFNDHVVDIVLSHHERFNGEGYPRGLRGKEIPLGARIISVVESYSAMIHERPNRPALSSKEALDTLRENYGLRYDREVVRQFVKIMEKEMARSVRPGVTVA